MEGKFFEQSKTFEKKILSFIKRIKDLDPQKNFKHGDLQENISAIYKFMRDPEFSQISPELKFEVKNTLKFLEELNPDTSFDMDSSDDTESGEFFVQIPAKEHLAQMKNMPAGGKEDQSTRLSNMTALIEKAHEEHPVLPIISTKQLELTTEWNNLFAAIKLGDKKLAIEMLEKIPHEDILLHSILAVHSKAYLKKIILYSIDALGTGKKIVNADILITPETFEILIRDIATSLLIPSKLCFSFGLPSHHAYHDFGAGFCILNKSAILIKHAELTHQSPLKYVIVGSDVNRDDGLCNILRFLCSNMPICHVDIFDSRVYPHHDHTDIEEEFNKTPQDAGKKIKHWTKDKLDYYAVDLSLTTRTNVSIHPALLFALTKIKESISEAKLSNQKIFLILPTGWDSHQDETAPCGKWVNGRIMGQNEAQSSRFNAEDIRYFFSSILSLYNTNKEHIEGIYWGLEGGYDKRMYTKELISMLNTILDQPFCKDLNQKDTNLHL